MIGVLQAGPDYYVLIGQLILEVTSWVYPINRSSLSCLNLDLLCLTSSKQPDTHNHALNPFVRPTAMSGQQPPATHQTFAKTPASPDEPQPILPTQTPTTDVPTEETPRSTPVIIQPTSSSQGEEEIEVIGQVEAEEIEEIEEIEEAEEIEEKEAEAEEGDVSELTEDTAAAKKTKRKRKKSKKPRRRRDRNMRKEKQLAGHQNQRPPAPALELTLSVLG